MAKPTYIYFWKVSQANGWASQWYPSPFTATLSLNPGEPGKQETVVLQTAEHWMMLQKALLFGDEGVARKVLGIHGTTNSDMKAVKGLGRKVRNFDEKVWAANRERIVYEGNLEKFRQNKELWDMLDATGDSVLVEASPMDKIWGIGIGEKKARERGKQGWRGQNLLGNCLGEVRDALREDGPRKRAKLDEESNTQPLSLSQTA